MPRLLLIVLGVGVLAVVAFPILRRHVHVETGMTDRHGVRAVLAAVGTMFAVQAPAQAVPPTVIGVNLSAPAYFRQNRALANLAAAGVWLASDRRTLGPDYLTRDGDIKQVPSGATLFRMLTLPAAGKSRNVTISCSWQGKGLIKPFGVPVESVQYGPSGFTFVLQNDPLRTKSNVQLKVSAVDPADPIRRLDCREAGLPTTARFDPAYVESLRGFRVIRFMDWQGTNFNMPVTWATRHLPGGIDTIKDDGISIEDMIALTKETGADPWFNMPWNADDDYYLRFAQLVHDTLPPDRTVYVELANEVWNHRFKVSKQAGEEGLAAALTADPNESVLVRYAQKTAHVMDIWAKVFADRPRRLVRVAACQNGALCAKTVLGFRDTARHVDALATAPYFGNAMNRNPPATADAVFQQLDGEIDQALDKALKAKAVAAGYGLRYIAYEGGQHLVFKDLALEEQVERDPRMYNAYKKYLEGWRTRIGDAIVLYNSSDAIGRYGSWGLVEFVGQPISAAPKMRAVREEIAITDRSKAGAR